MYFYVILYKSLILKTIFTKYFNFKQLAFQLSGISYKLVFSFQLAYNLFLPYSSFS